MLAIAGTSVIAFAVWSLAKVCMFLSSADESMLRQLLGINDAALPVAMLASAGAIALIDLALRVYVGLSVRAEARGEKKGMLYIVVALVVALGNVSSLLPIALGTTNGPFSLIVIISVVIEATSIAALVLVIYCSIRLRSMNKTTG